MSDALEEHDGKASIGGRNITNPRFADDIDAVAEEESLVWSHHLKQLLQVLEACYSAQILSFYLYLSLDAIDTVCHQFGLLRTDLHLIPCAGFVETFY